MILACCGISGYPLFLWTQLVLGLAKEVVAIDIAGGGIADSLITVVDHQQ